MACARRRLITRTSLEHHRSKQLPSASHRLLEETSALLAVGDRRLVLNKYISTAIVYVHHVQGLKDCVNQYERKIESIAISGACAVHPVPHICLVVKPIGISISSP